MIWIVITNLDSQLLSRDCEVCRLCCVVLSEASNSDSRFRNQSIVKLSTVNLFGSNLPEVSSTRFSSNVNLIGDAGLVLIQL